MSTNKSPLNALIKLSLQKNFLVFFLLGALIFAGLVTAPFDFKIPGLPRNPVAVDAIPDIGENQQIVFTDWSGRSPQDVEDQITYPLTTQLMGLKGVRTIRSFSFFGYSSIYVLFDESMEFYESRTRLLEKLSSLPANLLPTEVRPALGPDATALGQVFWYTLEGLDSTHNPSGGWDLDELRTINDYYVRYALQSVSGVAEVAAVGGMVKEYQIDVDPDKLFHYGISLEEVYTAISASNQEVGSRTLEINRVEYILRAKGYVNSLDDLKNIVVKSTDLNPILLGELAHIQEGPAPRRGALDKGGADVTGGVVVLRYGENPMEVLKAIQKKISEIAPGLPQRTLEDGTLSKVSVVPFYSREGLIKETLNTLSEALSQAIIITIIVMLFMLGNLSSSLLIAVLLPIGVLFCFVLMRLFNVEANVVALSGIAIAIGTMVDMGIILSENILRRLEESDPAESRFKVVYRATNEVSGAIVTAVLTTLISFIPVFGMSGAEAKLFKPLAYTKTFAIAGSLGLALFVIPPVAVLLFRRPSELKNKMNPRYKKMVLKGLMLLLTAYLAQTWQPLGSDKPLLLNFIFCGALLFGWLFLIRIFIQLYPMLLDWCLKNRLLFLTAPFILVLAGFVVWKDTPREFMPALDEGSFLYMPTTMPHASFGEAQEQLGLLDRLIESVPEVETAVGKLGRAESPLDPAPLSMYEIVINYKSEYSTDANGDRIRNWRPHIKSPNDIWNEVQKVAQVPGITSAPLLMPIAARIVMLQSGMRAPMGLKISGADLKTLETFGMELESHLKKVKGIAPATVIADRIVGMPYLEYQIDRLKAARYGLNIKQIHNTISTAIGGRTASWSVEGRERYAIRLRYMREDRDNLESLKNILVQTPTGTQIPISQVAELNYTKGPMVIKSEDGFLTSYVLFDKSQEYSEAEVVENAAAYLYHLKDQKFLVEPPGVHYRFAGNYENQIRARNTLQVLIPIVFFTILIILWWQFTKLITAFMVFLPVLVAWSGGFVLIGLYNTDWFLNINLMNTNLRDLFQIETIHLSVAVWVGFIALFGIATDDGVVMSEYLRQTFEKIKPSSASEVRALIQEAAQRRIRPCMMTTATTVLALIPVLTSQGRGSDIMLPMSVPIFGGMLAAGLSVFLIPVFWSFKYNRTK
jgi:Cu(I)/Ag(I) efflux system membrane protein CusA/SilA